MLDRIIEYSGYPGSILKYANGNNFSEHPTQKPTDLFENLIKTYTREGDVVLDPVVGSGTTAVAARNCKRRFICGDQSAEYVAVARDRLRMPFERRHVVQNDRVDDLPLFAGIEAR